METTGDPPPLCPQLTNSMPRRRSSSPLFTPPVLIILLPIIALLLLFFAVPPFLSITTQIFRPNGVRKSWDSLNIFLVLFAILCGVFARGNDTTTTATNNSIRNDSNNNKPGHPVSQQWFEYPDPPIDATTSATSVRRLKRSSSSYPDLRQDSLWENTEDRSRFFDDFEINKYRSSTNYNDKVHGLRRSWRSEFQESEAKVIHVDTFVLRSSPSSPPSKSPAPSTPPPPPPPPPGARHKSRRTCQAVGRKEKLNTQNDHVEFNKIKSPLPVTPAPPPPPLPPPRRPPSPLVERGDRSEQKYEKLERRKSNATKEIKMVFASLRKRKKKQKSKDHDHRQVCPLHCPRESPPYYFTTIPPPSPPPPPPPLPPPPSSVFQKYNLFRKGSKTKKFYSVTSPPLPPPATPPAFSLSQRSSKQNSQIPPTPPPAPPPAFCSTKRLSKQKSQISPPSKPAPAPPTPPLEPSRRRTTANIGRPPLPKRANSSYYDEKANSGGHSRLVPMPPPPPPFKMPELKFVVRGDFVKIRSNPSSRSSSPDLEEVDSSSKHDVQTVSWMDGDDGVGVGVGGAPVFCPSPDVNAKAETFIARVRDGWKLAKINSLKEKQRI